MGINVAIVALAISAVSTYQSVKASKQAAREQKNANKIQTAAQKNADAAARRQKIREERVRRAQILQQAENTGVSGSSGAIGAVGVLSNNLGQINANVNASADAAGAISDSNQRAADYSSKANTWNAVAGLSANVGGIAMSTYTPKPQPKTETP